MMDVLLIEKDTAILDHFDELSKSNTCPFRLTCVQDTTVSASPDLIFLGLKPVIALLDEVRARGALCKTPVIILSPEESLMRKILSAQFNVQVLPARPSGDEVTSCIKELRKVV